MSTYRIAAEGLPRRELEIRSVDPVKPFEWLRAGWTDLRAAPLWSAAYGISVACIGGAIAYLAGRSGQFYLVPFLFSGFLILTPLLSVGMMTLAKQREAGMAYDGATIRHALAARRTDLAMMGVFLVLVFVNWIMLSNLVYGGVFHEVLPTYERVVPLSAMMTESLPFLAIYAGIAILLAVVVFRITALSIPMMLDEKVDVFNAIFASWRATGENWRPMALWALLIAALCTLGFITYFLGFIVVIPWLGYASWHAYRETICCFSP